MYIFKPSATPPNAFVEFMQIWPEALRAEHVEMCIPRYLRIVWNGSPSLKMGQTGPNEPEWHRIPRMT